ncbi:MAG: exonuclease SbcCD subunit D [Lachnospiraceae bacterium]|nr:exonuclease SbcCD subunit D [Lachnospiraceae bacterium]MDD3615360.1 exonuclease SbcCD subunit D [Lachnospiraceae bacterium]
MRYLHVGDLHIGKRVNEFSMVEDQKVILNQIQDMVAEYQCDGILIAGDLYDKSMPSAEAVAMVDSFLTGLAGTGKAVYIISGNHDSAERISYCASLLEESSVYVSKAFQGHLDSYMAGDEYGSLNIYLLPFLKPVQVRTFYPEEAIDTYEDAIRVVLEHTPVDDSQRNILLAHQFVTGADICDSEEHIIGGLDNISAELFDKFDYVALGHIHGPQYVKRETIRYSGSILKYSFSEKNHHKSATLIDLKEKGQITIEQIPYTPLHDMRQVEGTLEEVMGYTYSEDYIRVVLKDELVPMDAIGTLRTNYPNIMNLAVDNGKQMEGASQVFSENLENQSPMELFQEFYRGQSNNQDMSKKQEQILQDILKEMGVL